MDKQMQDAKRRIKRITKRLEKLFALGEFMKINHVFIEGMEGDTLVGEEGLVTATKVTAITTTMWQYRSAKITWFLGSAAQKDDDYLEQTAIHEYVHMLMSPVTSFLFQYLRDDESAIESIRTLGQYAMLEEFSTESIMRVIGHAMRLKDVS